MKPIGVSLVLALVVSSFSRSAQQASAIASEAEALELFQSSCVTCHAPPDPRFATDRAWLTQVADTA